jgi:hypothetical protein
MAKFNVTVVRSDEYEIEIDESVWTKEEIKEWGNTFYGGSSLRDVASSLGEAWMKQGSGYFKEGFGYVRELDGNGNPKTIPFKDDEGNYCNLPDEKYTKGLTIRPITEDENYEVEVSRV